MFSAKMGELGAKAAAKEVNVGLTSFYNYVNGKTLPDLGVLRTVSEKWGTKWKHIDPSEILPKRTIRSTEQYVFEFLDVLKAKDVEIVDIGPKGHKTLQVTFKIRFTA